MRQGGVNSQYLCYRGSRLGLRYPGRPAPEQQRHLVAVMQLQIQQRSRTQSSQLLATRALPSCCRRNNFAYNCAFVVKRALITEQPSAAPVSLICMCDEVSREKGTGRDLFVPGVRRACFVLFCTGEVVGRWPALDCSTFLAGLLKQQMKVCGLLLQRCYTVTV